MIDVLSWSISATVLFKLVYKCHGAKYAGKPGAWATRYRVPSTTAMVTICCWKGSTWNWSLGTVTFFNAVASSRDNRSAPLRVPEVDSPDEDLNDHQELRNDPLLAVLVEKEVSRWPSVGRIEDLHELGH